VYSWRVNQNDLTTRFAFSFPNLNDSKDAITGRLGLGADDCELLTDKGVQ
jgi:hypothetical protein